MDKDTLARYEALLKKLAADIEAALAAGAEDSAPISLDEPIGRLGRAGALESQAFSVGMRAKLPQRLESVRRALEAVGRGDYGLCAACRKPIAEARLELVPDAPLCRECAT